MRILHADAKQDIPLADGTVQAIVTSPPYFGLRRYGYSPLEIGAGTLDQYVDDMRKVGERLWHVLKDDGLFWLNIGDTAVGSGGAGGDYNRGGSKEGRPRWRQGETGLNGPQWSLVPSKVAIGLQEDGWLVRSWIVWDKRGLRPEDEKHVRRPLVAHEVILMLAKQRSYKYFPGENPDKGDVWRFRPASRSSFLAPFPEDLPERCIRMSTEPGDLVLDPFVGSGTTLRVAKRLGRDSVGLDLYEFEGLVGVDRTKSKDRL